VVSIRWKHFSHRRVDSLSKSGVLFNSWQTLSLSSLFLRELQVFCPLILKSKPHKRHLPSFPDPTGLTGIRGDMLSPYLWGSGVLCILLDCEEFSKTHPHFVWSLCANRFCGLCRNWEKCHWLLRKRQCMHNRKHVGSRQRSLSLLSFLQHRERPLLTGNAYVHWKDDATFVTNWEEISAYLNLNILIQIHELPQLAMYWGSDQFIRVEGLKKTIPKQCF